MTMRDPSPADDSSSTGSATEAQAGAASSAGAAQARTWLASALAGANAHRAACFLFCLVFALLIAGAIYWRRTAMESHNRVEALLRDPKTYNYYAQMCAGIVYQSVGGFEDGKITYGGFWRDYHQVDLPVQNELRLHRAEAIDYATREIERLAASAKVFDLRAKPSDEEGKEFEEESHRIADMFIVLIDLNASDALPAILECEALSNRLLPDATADFEATKPWREGVDYWKSRRVEALSLIRATALSTVLAILRQERRRELLESEHEKAFVELMVPVDRDPDSDDASSTIYYPISNFSDPIYPDRVLKQIAYYHEIAFTPEFRRQIIHWAEVFLETTPPEKRLGAAGMAERPTLR